MSLGTAGFNQSGIGDNGPSAYKFSQVLRALVERNDSRGVIQLVERWLEYGTVSQTARVAQARALLDLKLMDKAWVRLREAATADRRCRGAVADDGTLRGEGGRLKR